VEVERMSADARRELEELERSRRRFLKAYRGLLERELDVVEVEESRAAPSDLDLDALRIFEGGRGKGEDPAWNSGEAIDVSEEGGGGEEVPGWTPDGTSRHETPDLAHRADGQQDPQGPTDDAAPYHAPVVDPYPGEARDHALPGVGAEDHHLPANAAQHAAPGDHPLPPLEDEAMEEGEASGPGPRFGVDLATARERESRTHDPG
jgi:hypothetical protein